MRAFLFIMYIQALHDKHPNWTFEAFNTGLDWNEVLKNEALLKRKLVPAWKQ